MKHLLFLGAAIMVVPSAHATDLVDAWQAAATHDPDYLAAQAQRDAGGESAVQARALKRPSVQFQGGYQYNVTETNARLPEDLEPVFTGSRSGGRASIAVQAVQPLYDASKQAQAVQLREKAAGADVQFAAEQQQLILRVGQAYFKLLAAQDRLASYQAQVAASEQQRRGAQARFDAGRARITDVREAEARRDASEAQRIGAEADLAYARADFAELTGLPTEGLERPADGFQAPPPPAGLEEYIEQAERRSPLVQAAVHQARAAGAEIDRYGLAGRPVVEGVAGYQGQYRLGGDSGNGIVPDRLQSASAGLRITIPLYAGGAIASKEREARANASKAAHDLDGARRDARLQAQQAWYGVSTGARRVAALDTAQRSAGLQQVAANTGREVGIRTQDDVLNAQNQSFSTDRDRRQAIYDYLTARLQLAAATGDLNGEALAGVNAMLQ